MFVLFNVYVSTVCYCLAGVIKDDDDDYSLMWIAVIGRRVDSGLRGTGGRGEVAEWAWSQRLDALSLIQLAGSGSTCLLLSTTTEPHHIHLAPISHLSTLIPRTYCSDRGGSVVEWLACWTQAQKGPGSNRSRGAVG